MACFTFNWWYCTVCMGWNPGGACCSCWLAWLLELLGEHEDSEPGVLAEVVGVGVGVELPPVVVDKSEDWLVSGRLSRLERG